MREVLELRIVEDFAPLLFSPADGERLGDMVRRITLDVDDPRVAQIRELDKEMLKSTNRSIFYSWNVFRTYTGRSWMARAFLN